MLFYKRLPANVPVHFGFDGSPNGYMFRGLWTVLSPSLLLCMTLLVLTTRPGFTPTTFMCWASVGLVYGSFFEIVRSSSSGGRFSPSFLLLGVLIMPGIEALVTFLLRSWWSH